MINKFFRASVLPTLELDSPKFTYLHSRKASLSSGDL
jgi:hypothetical protein